jgi:hypothetical protein
MPCARLVPVVLLQGEQGSSISGHLPCIGCYGGVRTWPCSQAPPELPSAPPPGGAHPAHLRAGGGSEWAVRVENASRGKRGRRAQRPAAACMLNACRRLRAGLCTCAGRGGVVRAPGAHRRPGCRHRPQGLHELVQELPDVAARLLAAGLGCRQQHGACRSRRRIQRCQSDRECVHTPPSAGGWPRRWIRRSGAAFIRGPYGRWLRGSGSQSR